MCPLCHSARVIVYAEIPSGRYFRCETCRLIYLDPKQRLSPEEERQRYEQHENDPSDARYRTFLNRLARPLVRYVAPGSEGLDYGAGPGPTLSVMLEEHGFSMEIYDPFFAPEPSLLERTYDFITCTETAEHFFSPADEFTHLNRMLRPGGWLGLMTEMRDETRDFEQWHYVREPTHVCFYHDDTMTWIAENYGWELQRPHKNVSLFRKPADEDAYQRAGERSGSA